MSPKRQVNHNIRKHFNGIIYNISRYVEIALSIVILVVIALAGVRLRISRNPDRRAEYCSSLCHPQISHDR